VSLENIVETYASDGLFEKNLVVQSEFDFDDRLRTTTF
jgi:hypothetical protein